ILDASSVAGATESVDQHTVQVPFSALTGRQIDVNTGSGTDSVTVDLSAGNLVNLINYNAGSGADQLIVTGGTFSNATFTSTNSNTGSIAINGNSPIDYSSASTITSTISVQDLTFAYSALNQTITLTDSGTAGETLITSTQGASVTFANPSSSLTINAGGGSD